MFSKQNKKIDAEASLLVAEKDYDNIKIQMNSQGSGNADDSQKRLSEETDPKQGKFNFLDRNGSENFDPIHMETLIKQLGDKNPNID